MNIPKYKGRELISFPKGWSHGWQDKDNFDPSGASSQSWSLADWREWREDYYLGLRFSPFGYDDSIPYAWPGRPYAPHGMSAKSSIPRLHSADE